MTKTFRIVFALLLMPMARAAHAFTLDYVAPVVGHGWNTTKLAFDIDYTDCPDKDYLDGVLTTAMGLWNGVPSANITLSIGNTVSQTPAQALAGNHAAGNPVIVCDPAFDADFGGGTSNVIPALASNGELTNPQGTKIYEALVLNVQPGATDNVSNLSAIKLSIVLAHEMGHVLGLGHSADPNALMYYNGTYKTNLSLGQDDMEGITYLYPRQEPGAGGYFGCNTVESGKGRRGGGAGGGDAAGAASLAALLGILAAITAAFKRGSPGDQPKLRPASSWTLRQ